MSSLSIPGSLVPGDAIPGSAGTSGPSQGWPVYYTTNFNPNPSAEVSTHGYHQLLGSENLSQDNLAYIGSSSLKVVTPGIVPGEGISTPPGSVIASATGSASAYVYGETGTLTVQAVQNPGGQILGQTQVTLDGQDWVRVQLDALNLTANDTIELVVFTTTPQALTFWVDCVQYEPESPANPYVDGSMPYATWTGASGLSTSYQQYQFPLTLSGGMTLEGTVRVTAIGEIFVTGTVAGAMDMSGNPFPMAAVSGTRTVIPPAIDPGVAGLPWVIAGGGAILASGLLVISPGSRFAQFAVFSSTDPDPAMTLIGYNNAGTQNAPRTATAYAQIFGTFTPPRQQLDSNGNATWQAAAYMAAGFKIASQAAWASGAPGTVNFTDVQVERAAQQGPSAYQLPRSLSTIIRPTRMNYIQNPSFEASGANWDEYWTAFGGATLTQHSGGAENGSYSMQVSVPSAGGGVYCTVPDLIFGDTFAASAYVKDASGNVFDVIMSAGSVEASAIESGYLYGSDDYGSGPYGGVPADATAMPGTQWYRTFAPFTAAASTVELSFTPVAVTGATYPLVFNIDAVLVEPGEVLEAYGDGSTDGWAWEAGGTPGLARSYYYERESVGVNAVQGVLQQHVPLGLTAYAPQYFTPPTQ